MSIEVYQSDGRLALTSELNFADRMSVLDLTNLAVGMYVVVGTDQSGAQIFREKVARL